MRISKRGENSIFHVLEKTVHKTCYSSIRDPNYKLHSKVISVTLKPLTFPLFRKALVTHMQVCMPPSLSAKYISAKLPGK